MNYGVVLQRDIISPDSRQTLSWSDCIGRASNTHWTSMRHTSCSPECGEEPSISSPSQQGDGETPERVLISVAHFLRHAGLRQNISFNTPLQSNPPIGLLPLGRRNPGRHVTIQLYVLKQVLHKEDTHGKHSALQLIKVTFLKWQ